MPFGDPNIVDEPLGYWSGMPHKANFEELRRIRERSSFLFLRRQIPAAEVVTFSDLEATSEVFTQQERTVVKFLKDVTVRRRDKGLTLIRFLERAKEWQIRGSKTRMLSFHVEPSQVGALFDAFFESSELRLTRLGAKTEIIGEVDIREVVAILMSERQTEADSFAVFALPEGVSARKWAGFWGFMSHKMLISYAGTGWIWDSIALHFVLLQGSKVVALQAKTLCTGRWKFQEENSKGESSGKQALDRAEKAMIDRKIQPLEGTRGKGDRKNSLVDVAYHDTYSREVESGITHLDGVNFPASEVRPGGLSRAYRQWRRKHIAERMRLSQFPNECYAAVFSFIEVTGPEITARLALLEFVLSYPELQPSAATKTIDSWKTIVAGTSRWPVVEMYLALPKKYRLNRHQFTGRSLEFAGLTLTKEIIIELLLVDLGYLSRSEARSLREKTERDFPTEP